MKGSPFPIIVEERVFQDILAMDTAVIFKHSPICGASAYALQQMVDFSRTRPEVRVFLIDVVEQRELSRLIADRLDVRHASPQVIVLQQGVPLWDASHFMVTAEKLREVIK